LISSRTNAAAHANSSAPRAVATAHRGVAQRKFLLDRLDQDIEDRTIEKIQRVDDGEQSEHEISPRCRRCGVFRRRGDLRRDIDLGFPRVGFGEAGYASRM
jgi:hypothetical protein